MVEGTVSFSGYIVQPHEMKDIYTVFCKTNKDEEAEEEKVVQLQCSWIYCYGCF